MATGEDVELLIEDQMYNGQNVIDIIAEMNMTELL
jgi:hypothetical protein